jgi:hypothetical protein
MRVFSLLSKSVFQIKNARGLFNLPKRNNCPEGYKVCSLRKCKQMTSSSGSFISIRETLRASVAPYFYYHTRQFAKNFTITIK